MRVDLHPAARRCRGRCAATVDPGRRLGSQSKVTSPIVTAAPGSAPCARQLVLDAEPRQPVGEVADRLVVVEVGLPDPALGLRRRARRTRRLRPDRADGEAGVVDGRGRSTIRVASATGSRPRGPLRPPRPARTSARAVPRGSTAEIAKTGRPRASRSGRTNSASSRASGTSILLSDDQPRPVGAARRRRPVLARARPRARRGRMSGSRPGSSVAQSRTCTSTEQRSMWRRKSRPSPLPCARAGDQPGHVGDGEGRLARGDDAEVRHQRGERVVGDLRPGRGQRRDQRRLAGAGEADQPDVGDASSARARRRAPRPARRAARSRAPCGAVDASAALPSPPRPPCGGDEAGADADQVGEHLAVARRARRCRRAPAVPGRRRRRRCGCCPRPACRCRPSGAGGGGSRAGCARCGRRRATTSPPWPPLPPSGPPSGLNFSRCTEATAVAAVAGGHVQHDAVDERWPCCCLLRVLER